MNTARNASLYSGLSPKPTAATPLTILTNSSAGSGKLLHHNPSTIVDDSEIEAETNAS
jgi:hypothetical protein